MEADKLSFAYFRPLKLPQRKSQIISFCVLDGKKPFLRTEMFGIIRFTSAVLLLFAG